MLYVRVFENVFAIFARYFKIWIGSFVVYTHCLLLTNSYNIQHDKKKVMKSC